MLFQETTAKNIIKTIIKWKVEYVGLCTSQNQGCIRARAICLGRRPVGTYIVHANGKKSSYSSASFEALTFDDTVAFMSCSSV